MRRLTCWLAGGGLLLLLAAGPALAGGSLRDETPDAWLLRPTDDGGEHVLLGPVSVTEPVISPEPQLPSSRGIKDQTTLRFSLLTPDTVLVGIYIMGTDGVLKPIQSFVPLRESANIPFRSKGSSSTPATGTRSRTTSSTSPSGRSASWPTGSRPTPPSWRSTGGYRRSARWR